MFDEQRDSDDAQSIQQGPHGVDLNSPLDVFYAILKQVCAASTKNRIVNARTFLNRFAQWLICHVIAYENSCKSNSRVLFTTCFCVFGKLISKIVVLFSFIVTQADSVVKLVANLFPPFF